MKKNRFVFYFSLTFLLMAYCSYADGKCGSLNERECINSDKCAVERGSSFCNADFCTGDLVFKGCNELDEKTRLRFSLMRRKKEEDKALCSQTNGNWIKSEFEKFGNCRCGKSKYFLDETGCTSYADECKKAGGAYYGIGSIKCNDSIRENFPEYCRKKYTFRSKYIHKELCLCNKKTLGVINRKSRSCSK